MDTSGLGDFRPPTWRASRSWVSRLRDGRDVEIGFADFFTIRDGLIVDRATYLEAAAV